MSRKQPDDEQHIDVNLHDEPMEKIGELPDEEDMGAIFEDCHALLDRILEEDITKSLHGDVLKFQERLAEALGWYLIQ